MPRNLNKSIDSRKIQSCVVECICYGCRSSFHNLLDDRLREHFHNQLFLFLFLLFHVIRFPFNADGKNLYSAQCVKNGVKNVRITIMQMSFWLVLYFTCMDFTAFLDNTPSSGHMIKTRHKVDTPHTWATKDLCNLSAAKFTTWMDSWRCILISLFT